jgi:hypothetical protein
MHDIGKPKTKELIPGGGVSFHHHEVVGSSMTKERLRTLRFDNHVIKDVAKLYFCICAFMATAAASGLILLYADMCAMPKIY